MVSPTLSQRLCAEALGTAFLLACIIGSGVMAERLAGGNEGLALLCNGIATGAILVVLITMLGPISGAHFNPAVTGAFALRGEIGTRDATRYIAVQILGGIVGVLAAHMMFDLPLLQASASVRTGIGQWAGELIATFGLVTTILLTLRAKPDAVAMAVGLFIASAYWFTSSTSFANPAVTIARTITDTFAGIRAADAPAFVLAQCIGAALAVYLVYMLTRTVVSHVPIKDE